MVPTHIHPDRLPLDPILLTITELLPKVQELQQPATNPGPSKAVLAFLRGASLDGVLPEGSGVSHMPRKFQVSFGLRGRRTLLIAWDQKLVRGGECSMSNSSLFRDPILSSFGYSYVI